MSIKSVKQTFIVLNFHKIQSILRKTDIFYQTNEFESTTGAKYHFANISLGIPYLENDFDYQQTLILTFTWWCFEERSKFYEKMSTDGARRFNCAVLY